MTAEIGYRFEDIVAALGNAATETLLRGGHELTFSTTARDAWVALVEAAARRMDEENRSGDTDLAAAQAAAREVISFAANSAAERGDEITEADISAALLALQIWPFSDVSASALLPAADQAEARLAATAVLAQQVEQINELLQTLPAQAELIDGLPPRLALARAALDAIEQPMAFLGLCPADGTRFQWDQTIRRYCCAWRHCPSNS